MNGNPPQSAVLELVRRGVKEKLTQSLAFNSLPREKQKEIAHDTVNALTYILSGENGANLPRTITMGGNHAAFSPAGALAGPTPATTPASSSLPKGGTQPAAGAQPASGSKDRQHPGFGESAREGSQAFTDTIANVNFPQFVGGLIEGVFNSIVTTSIKQMEAYAEMVKNVSKSVDQYMKDNVSENNARDYLADKYPDHLQVDIAGDKPKLKPKEGYDEDNMPDFFKDLGLKSPVTSLDEDNVEQELVPAARRRIAMDRQQLLATMVMMGVNRLVVTNGTIEASCMFELDTTDSVKRAQTRTTTSDWARARSSEQGQDGSYSRTNKADGKWDAKGDNSSESGTWSNQADYKQNWYSKGSQQDSAKFNITTASTASSEQTINLHAQLGGKVKVNFKSDYFPMEKMVDVLQVNQIQAKTAAGLAPQQPALPPPPPPPPMPALPAVTAPAPAAPAPAAPRA